MNFSTKLNAKVKFFSKLPYYELYRTIISEKITHSLLIQKKQVLLEKNSLFLSNYWNQISIAIFTINPIYNISEMIIKYISNQCNIILRRLLKLTLLYGYSFSEIVKLYLDQNQDEYLSFNSTREYKELIFNPNQLLKKFFSNSIFLNLASNHNSIRSSNTHSQDDNSIIDKKKFSLNSLSIDKESYLHRKAKVITKQSKFNTNNININKLKQDCFTNSFQSLLKHIIKNDNNSVNTKRNAIQIRSQSLNNIFIKQPHIVNKTNLNNKLIKKSNISSSLLSNYNYYHRKSRANKSSYIGFSKSNDYTTNLSKTISKNLDLFNRYSNDRNKEISNLSSNNNEGKRILLSKIQKSKKKKSKPIIGLFNKTIHNYFSNTDLYY